MNREIIGSFVAKDDSGNEYGITAFKCTEPQASVGDPDHIFRKVEYWTDDNIRVEKRSAGNYKLKPEGQKEIPLTSDDPNAV